MAPIPSTPRAGPSGLPTPGRPPPPSLRGETDATEGEPLAVVDLGDGPGGGDPGPGRRHGGHRVPARAGHRRGADRRSSTPTTSGPPGPTARTSAGSPAHPGVESSPYFSPDGKIVAFTGEYDGNIDVYVVPIEGGEPTRLTWHPGPDVVRGFTPDGTRPVRVAAVGLHRTATRSSSPSATKGGVPDARCKVPNGFRAAYLARRQVPRLHAARASRSASGSTTAAARPRGSGS